jgi:hypothetical protein
MISMGYLRSAGHPADRSMVGWAVDAAVVVVALASSLPNLFRDHYNPSALTRAWLTFIPG